MGKVTGIKWTDATFNPWTGCTRVSEGCRHCYAEAMSHRFPATLGQWGVAPRVIASESTWAQPLAWNRKAAKEGVRRRVFCASLADVFEDRPELREPRARLFGLIQRTPHLDWLLLTKRPENIMRLMRDVRHGSDPDLPITDMMPIPNLWLGTSVEDQRTANERIPRLLEAPAAVRFLSMEPLLGPVKLDIAHLSQSRKVHLSLSIEGALRNKSFSGYTHDDGRAMSRDEARRELTSLLGQGVKLLKMGECPTFDPEKGCPGHANPRVDWVIVGGESGPKARPMHPEWARSIRDQCVEAGVPYFFKQWGEWRMFYDRDRHDPDWRHIPEEKPGIVRLNLAGGCGFHGEKVIYLEKLGKKAAGRVLDGRTWDEGPEMVLT